MTPAQSKALLEYVDAVCDHMAHHVSEPNSRMRRYKTARNAIEAAFGIPVPPIEVPPLLGHVDLFALADGVDLVPSPQPPAMPDIL